MKTSTQWRKALLLLLGAIGCLSAPSAAGAQKAKENTTTEAEDAFGLNVDGQSLGLYDPNQARGFSPTAAGNIRLDGMYFDNLTNLTNRLVAGYRMLVGPSALGQPFPAPSGIADYHLRRPGDHAAISFGSQVDSMGGHYVNFDGQIPNVLPKVGIAAGAGYYQWHFGYGGKSRQYPSAIIADWKPSSNLDVTPFFGRIQLVDTQNEPTLVLSGDRLPEHIQRRHYTGQAWGTGSEELLTYGVLSDLTIGAWTLRASVIRSVDNVPIWYTPFFLNVGSSNVADRSLVAERGRFSGATSGEVQLSRTFAEGPRRHRFYLAAWGRRQERRYGASDSVDLGQGPLDSFAAVPKPNFVFGPQTNDRVRQMSEGLSYEGSWKGVGSVNFGIAKTQYNKTVVEPGQLPIDSRVGPLLYNAGATAKVSNAISLYASMSRGLEESGVAPSVAVNRDQATPAILTRQFDAGLQWAIGPRFKALGGAFEIEKPYYSLDDARVFRRLGRIRNRGLELSLAGSPIDGLSVVAGAVYIDSVVSSDSIQAGASGRRPVMWSPVSAIASFDYRFHGSPLSADASLQYSARQNVTLDDHLQLPAEAQLTLGMRYRFNIGGKPAVFRLEADNVTNTYAWSVVGSGALQVPNPRQIAAQLSLDI